jgi:hypothetical protein
VGLNPSKSLEVFARGSGGVLQHNWQTPSGPGGWYGWQSIGGSLVGSPVVGTNASGALEVFGLGTDGHVQSWYQTPPTWTGPVDIGTGTFISDPAVAIDQSNRIELFARATDGSMQYTLQGSSPGAWHPWLSLGGSILGNPAVGVNTNGLLDVFAGATDGTIEHWYLAAGQWVGPSSLNSPVMASDPAVTRNSSGRLEVFVRAADGSLQHAWQDPSGSGGWGAWRSMGESIAGDPTVATNANGIEELLARATDGTIVHLYQQPPTWSPQVRMPSAMTASDISVLQPDWVVHVNSDNGNGALEVFAIGTGGNLMHNWQNPGSPGGWYGWADLGGGF